MTTNTSNTAGMKALLELYDLHSKLFLNVLDGISEPDAQNRLNTKANHLSWIAGSLVQQTFVYANALGVAGKQTSHELFANGKGIQDGASYPPLDEYRTDWKAVRNDLRTALADATEEQLAGPDPFGMPGGQYTFFEVFGFGVHREAYCIGQIALYRRLLGYDAMKYE